jgi:hypothetical protein
MNRDKPHCKRMQPGFGELALASAADARRNAELVFSFIPAGIEQSLVSYRDQILCREHTVVMDYSAAVSST